jgi:hypothetical protein
MDLDAAVRLLRDLEIRMAFATIGKDGRRGHSRPAGLPATSVGGLDLAAPLVPAEAVADGAVRRRRTGWS